MLLCNSRVHHPASCMPIRILGPPWCCQASVNLATETAMVRVLTPENDGHSDGLEAAEKGMGSHVSLGDRLAQVAAAQIEAYMHMWKGTCVKAA